MNNFSVLGEYFIILFLASMVTLGSMYIVRFGQKDKAVEKNCTVDTDTTVERKEQ